MVPWKVAAILTVEPNDLVRSFHDRMPALLARERLDAWLDQREERPPVLLELLSPEPAREMECWPVSPRVNGVKAQGAELIEPLFSPRPSSTHSADTGSSVNSLFDTE